MKTFKGTPLFLLLLFFLQGCIFKPARTEDKMAVPAQLVIYCENGVLAPVLEITEKFRHDNDIDIHIQNDCSQSLINLLQFSRDADIFIPDSRQAIDRLRYMQPGIFSDSVFLGYNPLVFIVPKGNPMKFDGKFKSLTDRRFSVILSNPQTSSLGYETQQILMNQSVFDALMRGNVVALSVDSRGLLKSVATGQASVTIDWLSSYKQNSNYLLVDTLLLPSSAALPEIYANSLSSSSNPLMAQAFLETLKSENSSEIFLKYGIRKRPLVVF